MHEHCQLSLGPHHKHTFLSSFILSPPSSFYWVRGTHLVDTTDNIDNLDGCVYEEHYLYKHVHNQIYKLLGML